MEKTIEKRKHTRYRVKGRVLAALSLAAGSQLKLGHIQNISEGGLSLVRIAEGEELTGPVELQLMGHEIVSIFDWKIPSRIVYEENFPHESVDFPEMRRCGVVFDELSVEELESVRYFIRSNLLVRERPLAHRCNEEE